MGMASRGTIWRPEVGEIKVRHLCGIGRCEGVGPPGSKLSMIL